MKRKNARFLAFALLLLAGMSLPNRAEAEFVFTTSPFGNGVRVEGSGSVLLDGASYDDSFTDGFSVIVPSGGVLMSGVSSTLMTSIWA